MRTVRHKIPLARALAMFICCAPVLSTAQTSAGRTAKAYVASYGSNNISIVDTSNNAVIKTIQVSAGAGGVAVSQDGTRAYVTVEPNLVYAIDTLTDSVIKIIKVGGSPSGITVLPSGSAVYVTNSTDGTVSVIDTLSLTVAAPPLQLQTPFSYPTGVGVSHDGGFVYVSSSGNLDGSPYINVIRTSDNSLVTAYKNPQKNLQIAISPDGSTGYAAGVDLKTGTGNVSVFNTRNGTILATVPMGSSGGVGIVLSPDGTIAYATDKNVVYVINTAINKVIDVISTGSATQLSGAMGLSVSQDGSNLYVADGLNFLKVIDTKSHKPLTQVLVGSHPISIGSFVQLTGKPPTEPCPLCSSIANEYDSPADKQEALLQCHMVMGVLKELSDSRVLFLRYGHFKDIFPTVYYHISLLEMQHMANKEFSHPIEAMQQILAFFDAYEINRNANDIGGSVEPQWQSYYAAALNAENQMNSLFPDLRPGELGGQAGAVLNAGITAHVSFDLSRALRYSFIHRFHQVLTESDLNPDFLKTNDLFENATTDAQDDLYNGFKNSHWWQAQWLRVPFIASLLQNEVAKGVIAKRLDAWRIAFFDNATAPLPTLSRPQPVTDHALLVNEGVGYCSASR